MSISRDIPLVLSFEPDAIREHFQDDGDERATFVAGLSDDDLRAIGWEALTDDAVYAAFHAALASAVVRAEIQ